VALKRLMYLVGGSLLFWLLIAIPARHVSAETLKPGYGGDPAFFYSLTAVIICLLPTAITLYWGMRTLNGLPEQQLTLVMGGTGIRMFFVLLVGLAFYKLIPYYEAYEGFWIWLLIFYLFTLALEMVLLLAGQKTNKA
jgi:hypothetical protein